MEVDFTPEQEAQIAKIAASSGADPEAIVKDATMRLLDELAETRIMLDSRYDDVKSGKVKLISGKEVFARLREKSANGRQKMSV